MPQKVTAQQIADWTNGEVLQDAIGEGFQFDSRLLETDEWFIVLQGARDGHEFLPKALECGCAGAIGQKMPNDWTRGFIQVDNSLQAFQDIAIGMRASFEGTVVAITGSAGKTTTRALISAMFQEWGTAHQTNGNFNNHIGVPKTITDSTGNEDVWILEMGMNALGEIHTLQEIAQPTIRVITNVGEAHVEGCGSIDGVAKAKGELFDGANRNDICCINIDDPWISNHPIPNGAQRLTYGRHEQAEIRLIKETIIGWSTHVQISTNQGIIDTSVDVPGSFMAHNICATVAVGVAAGIPLDVISTGIQQYQPVGMRMRVENVNNITIINDAYNANPLSMKAALDTLAQHLSTDKIAFLGDMLEMGNAEHKSHCDVLQYALEKDIKLGLVGERFKRALEDIRLNTDTSAVLWTVCSTDDLTIVSENFSFSLVLLKGSRGMRMERILKQLKER